MNTEKEVPYYVADRIGGSIANEVWEQVWDHVEYETWKYVQVHMNNLPSKAWTIYNAVYSKVRANEY